MCRIWATDPAAAGCPFQRVHVFQEAARSRPGMIVSKTPETTSNYLRWISGFHILLCLCAMQDYRDIAADRQSIDSAILSMPAMQHIACLSINTDPLRAAIISTNREFFSKLTADVHLKTADSLRVYQRFIYISQRDQELTCCADI